jgi:tRNA(Ile2) C34 agmatinyltransferase TiaS
MLQQENQKVENQSRGISSAVAEVQYVNVTISYHIISYRDACFALQR